MIPGEKFIKEGEIELNSGRKTVTLTGASLSGADAGNYLLDSVATTTAEITIISSKPIPR